MNVDYALGQERTEKTNDAIARRNGNVADRSDENAPDAAADPRRSATAVTGPHDGRDGDGRLDHRYWRCERCGFESADPRLRDGCFRCDSPPAPAGSRADSTRPADAADVGDADDTDDTDDADDVDDIDDAR
ncbi:hypothetical protein [Halegenticoccus tardaugens]|uniref:hypothetical protein n=1 Tax=Halegenticoccus tardaugens TaxID=2071624 RepID=UPI00100A4475|nr:hypothetical protein [Halegenticoccus tardaugens]